MAIVIPAVQSTSRDGVTPTFGAANADGYAIPCDGKTVMELKNAGASACVVSQAIPGTYDGLAVVPKTVTVPITTGDKWVGPFNETYNQPSGAYAGKALITFDQVTSVTVAFFRVGG